MKTTKRKNRSTAPARVKDAAHAPGTAASGAHVVLAGHCCVKDAAALKQSLCDFVAEPALVMLDAHAVERIDTAAIQLLCAFARERAGQGYPIAWSGDTAIVREAAAVLGVEPLLSLPPMDAAMTVSASKESAQQPAMNSQP
ncbi:STAS domain-containing protein [Steroidobacter denitrificans]|uniref:STAS domain-containing protein n=1 Tax=Steroidobacter denitrificans TaxID=465721 RepID=UPI00082B99AC|nr:STAS domain-containing protein [Steroidobacter denitrificans]